MKKRLIALVVGLLLVLPFTVYAETESMGLADTFAAEDIELSTKYKETDKQATVYLFRGQGCSHCLDLLNYLNSILGEYGDKFKLVSYEVWNNTDNADLEEQVAELLNADVQKGSVPFLIIGDQYYIGFKDDYGEDIKEDIDDLYKSEERYDVVSLLGADSGNSKKTEDAKKKNDALWVIIPLLVILILYFLLKKDKPAYEEAEEVAEEKEVKEEKKAAAKKTAAKKADTKKSNSAAKTTSKKTSTTAKKKTSSSAKTSTKKPAAKKTASKKTSTKK